MIAGPFELKPEQFLHFIELDEFQSDWRQLGLDLEHDLLALQLVLMHDPGAGVVVPGTDGLRKLRFSPRREAKGKRGSIRVCYVWWPAYWLVLLVMAYRKSVKDDLTPEEKDGIRDYLQRVERWLASRRKPAAK